MSAHTMAESLSPAELCARLDATDEWHSHVLCALMMGHQAAIEANLASDDVRLDVALARMVLHSRENWQLRRELFP